jgi:hypothetical protein
MKQGPSSEVDSFSAPCFTEPKTSLPFSQGIPNRPFPEPDQFSQGFSSFFFNMVFNNIFPATSGVRVTLWLVF